jgi:hypothetical protein
MKDLLKNNFYLLLMILLISSSNQNLYAQKYQPTSPPTWFVNPPKRDGLISAVGTGETNAEAILNSLVDLSNKLETKVETLDSGVGSSNSILELKGIAISSKIERVLEETGGSTSLNWWKSNSTLLTKNMQITSIIEEKDDNTTFHSLEIMSQDTPNGLLDLYNDLESLGIKIKSKNYLDQVFILLTIDQASLGQMKK